MTPGKNESTFVPSNLPISGEFGDVSQPLIRITYDRLWKILTEHCHKVSRSRDWMAPLGVFLTILVTLVSADFKEALAMSKDTWKAIFVIVGAGALLFLARGLWNIRGTETVYQLANRIKNNADDSRGGDVK